MAIWLYSSSFLPLFSCPILTPRGYGIISFPCRVNLWYSGKKRHMENSASLAPGIAVEMIQAFINSSISPRNSLVFEGGSKGHSIIRLYVHQSSQIRRWREGGIKPVYVFSSRVSICIRSFLQCWIYYCKMHSSWSKEGGPYGGLMVRLVILGGVSCPSNLLYSNCISSHLSNGIIDK